MISDPVILDYCRAVERELELPKQRRKELLTGFRQELEEHFSGGRSISFQQLRAEAGTPLEAAAELMDGVPAEERRLYHSRRRLLFGAVIAACIVMTISALCFAWYMHAISGTAIIETHEFEGKPKWWPKDGEGYIQYHYEEGTAE